MNNRYYWGLRFESLRSFELKSFVFFAVGYRINSP